LVETWDAGKHPTIHKIVPNKKNYLVQNVKSTKVEKPHSNGIFTDFVIHGKTQREQAIHERGLNVFPRDKDADASRGQCISKFNMNTNSNNHVKIQNSTQYV
jgi:hypothetical protein